MPHVLYRFEWLVRHLIWTSVTSRAAAHSAVIHRHERSQVLTLILDAGWWSRRTFARIIMQTGPEQQAAGPSESSQFCQLDSKPHAMTLQGQLLWKCGFWQLNGSSQTPWEARGAFFMAVLRRSCVLAMLDSAVLKPPPPSHF